MTGLSSEKGFGWNTMQNQLYAGIDAAGKSVQRVQYSGTMIDHFIL